MKHLLISLIAAALSFAPAQPTSIALEAAWAITAGEAWELTVRVADGAIGSSVDAVLLNGLHRYDARLTLGSGGIARWNVGVIANAGASLVLVQAGDHQARHALTVRPGAAAQVEALTTTNSLPAYGAARGMVIALASDAWGNPLRREATATAHITYPRAAAQAIPLRYASGLFWMWLPSRGSPGRVWAELSIETVRDAIELRQVAGEAAHLLLTASLDCLDTSDERDVLMLSARVTDAWHAVVSDGTLVTFAWGEDGSGTAPTINGQAVLEIPAQIGHYRALTTGANSNPLYLDVCK